MERLTNPGTKEAKSNVTIRQVLDKLAEYEDLEEQGLLLLRLPCKLEQSELRLKLQKLALETDEPIYNLQKFNLLSPEEREEIAEKVGIK